MRHPDFYCHTELPAGSVTVIFQGTFHGRGVTWEMRLATLSHFRCSVPDPSLYRCPFIEIKPPETDVVKITVALELPSIDEPAILKTIIMIRNYKRLAVGKHEFCSNEDG